ncbi:MAG: hypothetical protein WDO73_16780 [Ignavibacteriota bacterium]
MMATSFLSVGYAADDPNDKSSELAKLKAQLEAQQKQIEQLSDMLVQQKKLIEQVTASGNSVSAPAAVASTSTAPAAPAAPAVRMLPNLGEVASATPVMPPPPPAPAPRVLDPQVPAGDATAPLQLKIGDATIQPIGFMDFTMEFKSENAGGSIGSNFGSVPYNNGATGRLSEFRFSPQNSRIGFRIDANVKGAHVMAYNENDFLGTSGANNISVTNGAFVPRLRLFWVDIRKGQWEIMGGQSWSMMTANRKGISPLPGDVFFSQATDVNYIAGMVWDRQPGIRFVYHPSDKVALGLALENPDAYIGGTNGAGTSTLPTALASLAGAQLDNATNVQTTPNLHPDIIAKLAFDPSSRVHFEVAGIERTFKIWNPNTNVYFTKVGGGGAINGNFELVKGLRLITNNFWSDGGGRYIFGSAPDLILRSDGSISPIHAGGVNEGFEIAATKNLALYAYYGGIYVGKNTALDANGTSLIGYGYRGSANSQDRTIQEVTFGFNQTIWKDVKWGAVNVMGQYAYIFREPWYVAPNTPKGAHDNTIYLNLRYTLPGAPPAMK